MDKQVLQPRLHAAPRARASSPALAAVALLALALAGPVSAQQAVPASAQAASAAASTAASAAATTRPAPKADVAQQVLVVTGTRFLTPNASSPAPVSMIDASELARQGTTKTEDLLISLPQANAGLTDSGVGVAQTPLTGTATVDLRGVGAFRTLVLMNGRRINPGDAINPSADLHTIPEILIKRVEVLTGGASSIYGSDAEAGVVNLVMDTDYTGGKLVVQGGGFYDGNNRGGLHEIARASGVEPNTSGVFDGQNYDVNGVFGTDFAGKSGHVVVYAGLRQSAGILASSRDFSACTLQETGSSYGCLLDGTTPRGQFVNPDGSAYTLDASGTALRPYDPAADGYNFSRPESLQRPDKRSTAGIFAHYTVNPHAQLYLEGTYMHDETSVQYEPSGTAPSLIGPQVYAVPCSNPLLSASEFNILCTQNGLTTAGTAQVGIGRRNVEGGPLGDNFRHTSYRVVFGVKGHLDADWTYDASVNYGKVTANERVTNDISITRLTNALNVVSVGGTPTCQSVVDGSDPACVPYNIWSAGGVTPAALGYITGSGGNAGYATQKVVSAQVVGDLGAYGLTSPWAEDSLDLALGTEYRSETVSNQPSDSLATGDLMYASNVLYGQLPTAGSFNVREVFAELKVPLIENRPFAKELSLDLADRYARYNPQGGANAYNLGAVWAPIDQVRFRAGRSQAIRAANGHELFLGQSTNVQPIADPCSGPTPTASQAGCANTGLPAAQYGAIPVANGINVVTGGNDALKPEHAKSITAGVVFTNFRRAPSLLASIDYWQIDIKNYIGSIPASVSLPECVATGNPIFCNLVRRGPGGSLTAGRVLATRANTGNWAERGIDFAAQYAFALDPRNRLGFAFNGSKLLSNRIAVNPAVPVVDCAGLFGASCSNIGPTSPIPHWRHSLRTTWTHAAFEASLNWRHIGAMDFEGTNAGFSGETVYAVDSHVPSYDYFDLSAGYHFPHVDVRMGINNMFGKNPPIAGYGANPLLLNGNLLAGIYDPFGRTVFMEVAMHL
ncbi:MAG: TonB-dependent receptor [Burkholderiales bacterium]|nr:TonB-dependent receptor [Burkholderiales bacterium]